MRDQEPNGSGTRGSILFLGSVTASDPAPEFFATHAYAAAKGAINALMTTMAAAYLPDRIRVNVVAPGLTRDADGGAAPPAIRAIRAYGARKQPLAGELMDPDEVAQAAVYFLSDESRAVTGQLLKVDGGWSIASVSPEPPDPAVTFVRTVLGDIEPADAGRDVRPRAPRHRRRPAGRAVAGLPPRRRRPARDRSSPMPHAAGLRTAVDMMPADCGRNPAKLAELSRRTGVHLVAATGLHHERFYGPSHWSLRATEDELADLFVADIEDGHRRATTAAARSSGGPRIRAGVVKVAGSDGGPSARDLPIFRGAAARPPADRRPRPHPLRGRHGRARAAPRPDATPACRRSTSRSATSTRSSTGPTTASIVASGAFAVYDQAFRWGDRAERHAPAPRVGREDGHLDRVMLGMDAARQGYYRAFGGAPGLTYLLREFSGAMDARGLDAAIRHRLFVDNPARAFAFTEVRRMSHEPLLTSVVGSHAHPGWFAHAIAAAERGEYGPGRPRGAARRRRRPRDPRPGAGRDRRDQRRRDAPGRLLHGRVLPPPDRRPGAAARPAARRRRPRRPPPVRGRSRDRGAERARRRRRVPRPPASGRIGR